VHHQILCEPLTKPFEVRQEYIRREKPADEVELRLRLFKPVVGPLPERLAKAGDNYDKARANYDKACKVGADYDKARADYVTARADYVTVRADYVTVRANYDKARANYDKARADYVTARADCDAEIEALHARECPNCPWDGKTIFPEAGGE